MHVHNTMHKTTRPPLQWKPLTSEVKTAHYCVKTWLIYLFSVLVHSNHQYCFEESTRMVITDHNKTSTSCYRMGICLFLFPLTYGCGLLRISTSAAKTHNEHHIYNINTRDPYFTNAPYGSIAVKGLNQATHQFSAHSK